MELGVLRGSWFDRSHPAAGLLGKTVVKVLSDSSREYFKFELESGENVTIGVEGDCCSSSWIEHMSGLEFLIGQTVLRVEDVEMGEIDHPNDGKFYECLQSYSLKVWTTNGLFEMEYRNDSNGYYGGSVTGGYSDKCNIALEEDF